MTVGVTGLQNSVMPTAPVSKLRWGRWWRIGWKAAIVVLILTGLLRPWIAGEYGKYRAKREIARLNGLAFCQYRTGVFLGGLSLEFGPLDQVILSGPQVDDSSLEILQEVPDLRVLFLNNTRVTDGGLAQLRRSSRLNCLFVGNVDYTKIIGAKGAGMNTIPLIKGNGYAALRDLPHLEMIQTGGPETTDETLRAIKQVKILVFLDLMSAAVTDEGVADLKRALPNCKVRRR